MLRFAFCNSLATICNRSATLCITRVSHFEGFVNPFRAVFSDFSVFFVTKPQLYPLKRTFKCHVFVTISIFLLRFSCVLCFFVTKPALFSLLRAEIIIVRTRFGPEVQHFVRSFLHPHTKCNTELQQFPETVFPCLLSSLLFSPSSPAAPTMAAKQHPLGAVCLLWQDRTSAQRVLF